jgi:hypothetical protein
LRIRKRAWTLVSVFALGVWTALLLGPVPVASAQEPPAGLNMEAIAAFGGHCKYGEWLPVWAYLQNNGPDLNAEVRVRVTGSFGTTTFAARVSLPTGSRKRVPVYVLPNNFSRALEVQLVDDGENVLILQKVQVKPQPNISFVVGLVTPERGALSLIAGAMTSDLTRSMRPRSLVLIDLPVAELPERPQALGSFDCLILNNVDTSSLTPAQQAALESWVRQGGRLVIGGGAGARKTVSGLGDRDGRLESLLPLIPGREVEVDALPGLIGLGGGEAVRVPGPFLVSVGDLAQGRTLAEQDGLPLVRERSVGKGYVDFVALDLATLPFDAWAGTMAFWARLILDSAAYPQDMPPDMSPRQMRADQMAYALSNLPSLALPSVRGLTILLAAYVLLVGPINYLVLRWRRRLHWAWGTIPLITALFSGGAFGLGYAMRGTDLILNKIAIVAAQPDGTAQVNAYVGLFSPSRQSYEIEVKGGGLLSSLNPGYDPFGPAGSNSMGDMVFVQGDPGWVRGLAVNQWSMQTFMVEESWPDFGQVKGDLGFGDGALVGTVRNGTGQMLKDAVVAMGAQFTRLGDLAPGAEAEVRLDLSAQPDQLFGPPISYRLFEREFSQPGPGGPPRDVQLKQQILDSILSSGTRFGPLSSFAPSGGGDTQGLIFLAWFDTSPPQVQVAGREPTQQTTALLYTPLAYRLAEGGIVSVPAGFIPGRIVEMPPDGGPCGPPGTSALYIGRGDAVFEFQLPEVRDVQVTQLAVSIRSEGGWQQPPKAALYDWVSETWAELEEPVWGSNLISDAQSLVNENGSVQVRLSVENSNHSACFYLGLGFEGER